MQGRFDRRGSVQAVHFVLVAQSRPEEAAQTIATAPGQDVDVQVGHALADVVVDRDERAVGLHRHPYGAAEAAGGIEQRADEIDREVVEGSDVAAGYQQGVAGEHGVPIEEGERLRFIEDDVGWQPPGDDFAERARAHGPRR